MKLCTEVVESSVGSSECWTCRAASTVCGCRVRLCLRAQGREAPDFGTERAGFASVASCGACDSCFKLDIRIDAIRAAMPFNLSLGKACRALQVGCAFDTIAWVLDAREEGSAWLHLHQHLRLHVCVKCHHPFAAVHLQLAEVAISAHLADGLSITF